MNNLSYESLVDEVESLGVRVLAGQASGYRTFKRIIENQDFFDHLITYVSEEKGARNILNRIMNLSIRDVDPKYENPFDTALSVYLMALDRVKPTYAEQAAIVVMSVPQTWWAKRIGIELLDKEREQISNNRINWNMGKQRQVETSTNQDVNVLQLVQSISAQSGESKAVVDGNTYVDFIKSLSLSPTQEQQQRPFYASPRTTYSEQKMAI